MDGPDDRRRRRQSVRARLHRRPGPRAAPHAGAAQPRPDPGGPHRPAVTPFAPSAPPLDLDDAVGSTTAHTPRRPERDPMAHALYRLGRLAHRRWPAFLVGWLAVLIAIGGAAATMSQPMSDKFTIPGIPSEEAQSLQQELFPDAEDPMDTPAGTVV